MEPRTLDTESLLELRAYSQFRHSQTAQTASRTYLMLLDGCLEDLRAVYGRRSLRPRRYPQILQSGCRGNELYSCDSWCDIITRSVIPTVPRALAAPRGSHWLGTPYAT